MTVRVASRTAETSSRTSHFFRTIPLRIDFGDARGGAQGFFTDLDGLSGSELLGSQVIEHAKFGGLFFRSAARTRG